MSQQLLGTLLSAVIAGVFSLIAKRMELDRSRKDERNLTVPATGLAPQLAARAINYGAVVRQIGIIQLIANLVGFLIGLAVGATGGSLETLILMILLVGTIVLAAAFFWCALSVECENRWRHLVLVAVGVAITTVIINSMVFQRFPGLVALAVALVQNLIAMGIGGYLARTIKR